MSLKDIREAAIRKMHNRWQESTTNVPQAEKKTEEAPPPADVRADAVSECRAKLAAAKARLAARSANAWRTSTGNVVPVQ